MPSGFKGKQHTAESKLAISLKHKGKTITPEQKAKRAATVAAWSDEKKAAVSAKRRHSHAGMSDETKRRMSASAKGKKKSPEHVAKIVAANKARRLLKVGNREENIAKKRRLKYDWLGMEIGDAIFFGDSLYGSGLANDYFKRHGLSNRCTQKKERDGYRVYRYK
jgi:hypothetical protein